MVIKFTVRNKLGVFESEKMEVSEDQYKNLIDKSKKFWETGFEMWLENGFMVIPPKLIKKSIFSIDVII